MKRLAIFVFVYVLVAGCAATPRGTGGRAIAAGTAESIIGRQSDAAAEGAVTGAATAAVDGAIVGERMEKKFCPVCGKRYTSSVEYCPYDGAQLQLIGGNDN